jgi:hypothetical protein
MISNRSSLEEKEKLIASWDFPWNELLSQYQQSRDIRLKSAEDDGERNAIEAEYEQRINRMITKR